MGQKQKAHDLLESMIQASAAQGVSHQAVIDVPHYELSRELGFADKTPMGNLRITITAEYQDEDEYIYEKESGIAVKNKTPQQ